MKKALADPELFGNEAGEDEPLEILSSYFVNKPDFQEFFSPQTKYKIVKSKKGVGKSTLLMMSLNQRRQEEKESICIYLKGSDLNALQQVPDRSPNGRINGWQQRICSYANRELGKYINVALGDYDIALVEASELGNFKERNIVSSLLERIRFNKSVPNKNQVPISDPYNLIKSRAEKNEVRICLFIDDIDATFISDKESRLEISTFFTACRYLVNSVQGIYIRASVRTDVWDMISSHDEALDKCNQYILDLKWSTGEVSKILCKKISSYFVRNYPNNPEYSRLDYQKHSREILRLIFTKNFRWNGRPVPPDRPIYILSAGRPRWASHLCKLASKSTLSRSGDKISVGDIDKNLKQYGQFRLSDLYKEHGHQCSKLKQLIEMFAGGKSIYSTAEIYEKITREIYNKYGSIEIDGNFVTEGVMGVAHFLFRIGFICGRNQENGDLGFVRFEDRPDLLTASQNPDDGLPWEIHPTYRSVLRIERGISRVRR